MGQVPAAWCREGADIADCSHGAAGRGCSGGASSRQQRAPNARKTPDDAELLLTGCPRELAEAIRETGQWGALRCRPWLSAGALRGLFRSLQYCQPRQLSDRYLEAEAPEECTFALPQVISWSELDADHVVCAGQVFRLEDADPNKVQHLQRVGLQALKQGKVGVVLMAGGMNLRLGGGDTPVACSQTLLGLRSGKSILQLLCERIRRIARLCATEAPDAQAQRRGVRAASRAGAADAKDARASARPPIPVFVMTSRVTHRAVVEHFEANGYFGLPPRDVQFFQQPVSPVLDMQRRLLPQSLGGEFAQAPGGTGAVLRALAGTSALEQMRDRGVESLHILGTENLLARVCDPVFIGFCRDLEVDCACKVAERVDASEDMELFCVRQSPVSTQFADIEEAACGLPILEAPEVMRTQRNILGALSYCGSINTAYMTVTYVEEVVGRSPRPRRLPRALPYLDFHVDSDEQSMWDQTSEASGAEGDGGSSPTKAGANVGVAPGTWPAESASPDMACQRALMVVAAEVRSQRKSGLFEREAAARCDVHLDASGPTAVVRVKGAARGPLELEGSLGGAMGPEVLLTALKLPSNLRCSLVIPSQANAVLLETSLLDYFAYTDRAVALQVLRDREFAAVSEARGVQVPDMARRAMHSLHCAWVLAAGARIGECDSEACLEVSPLVSYEGEGLGPNSTVLGVDLDGSLLAMPCHLTSNQEEAEAEQGGVADGASGSPAGAPGQAPSPLKAGGAASDEAADGLDTRPFYLQEYARRPDVSWSHVPRFGDGPSGKDKGPSGGPGGGPGGGGASGGGGLGSYGTVGGGGGGPGPDRPARLPSR